MEGLIFGILRYCFNYSGTPEFMTRRSMLTVTVAQTRQNI